ncbi:MAG: diaminopimelate epimerase [Syntrophus sp. (in: bacteria)]|nr:diaminopimelate epimerase [Syntrophus sp. (in: bacteria)]
MSGSGNDFILIDNRGQSLPAGNITDFVKRVCERKVSVGADGLILIERSDRADFRWRFFNADGSEVDMCGNGGRCAARFAFLRGIAGPTLSFETGAGLIDAEVKGDTVKLRLTEPHSLCLDETIDLDGEPMNVSSINTGVPHVVHFTGNLDIFDVFNMGRHIRYHRHYQPAGTNANFVTVTDRHALRIRTYERGVEDETLACGTGSVAAALISSRKGWVDSPVAVTVKSGEILTIYFDTTQENFGKVYLEGKAAVVYEGRLWEEAYQ